MAMAWLITRAESLVDSRRDDFSDLECPSINIQENLRRRRDIQRRERHSKSTVRASPRNEGSMIMLFYWMYLLLEPIKTFLKKIKVAEVNVHETHKQSRLMLAKYFDICLIIQKSNYILIHTLLVKQARFNRRFPMFRFFHVMQFYDFCFRHDTCSSIHCTAGGSLCRVANV